MATGNDLLVGSTGFVGGNLSRQHVFGKPSILRTWKVLMDCGHPSASMLVCPLPCFWQTEIPKLTWQS